ncbi:MAG: MmcQ/YjbR family DNA-binding protein [Dehalococcoidia bacterium]|nr:MAG: MmcQ/YjbR family DNA-binding protein [Dehalococcoidia bacterium]
MPAARNRPTPKPPADPFERVRALCLALPEVTERPSHSQPAFFVAGKMFVTFSVNLHGDGEEAIWIKAAPGVQEMLIAEAPEHFYRPPYVGHQGTVAARLNRAGTPWEDIDLLIRDAWMMMAPKRLAATLAPPDGERA